MSAVATGYVVTAAGSLLLLALAWRCPRAGRLAFAALFVGASVFNAVTAIKNPTAYVDGFAPHAFPPMREFLERVVALVPDAFVLTIAAGQLLAGVGLAIGRGTPFHAGVIGAACFLTAISWLGIGAAFPLNLVMAAGVLLLLRRSAHGRRAS